MVGTAACNASCPFCISRITGYEELERTKIHKRNFRKACQLAKIGNCTTVLFTGKGEPTLPNGALEITEYLKELRNTEFPFIELQTNGIRIGRQELNKELSQWYELGLTTIAISVVDVDKQNNGQIYLPNNPESYPDLQETIKYLHDFGFIVRLCVMMHKGMVDSVDKVANVIDFCRDNNVEQLTLRSIRFPLSMVCDDNLDIQKRIGYITSNRLTGSEEDNIINAIREHGQLLMTIKHGNSQAEVYDVKGQNVCISDCLTLNSYSDDIRTLIFYSNGRLTYDWVFRAARLL